MGVNGLRDTRGLTLMEVTFALAIFAVVTAVTAQALTSFYVALDIQEQRIEAVRVCMDVMGAVREERETLDAEDWPGNLVAWVEAQNDEGWPQHQREGGSGLGELPAQAITVECTNLEGQAPVQGDVVVMVRVYCTWEDRAGHALESQVVTALANE